VIGGSGRQRSARLAAEYAAEYNVAFATQEQISAAFRGVAAACADAGRSADSMRWSVGHRTNASAVYLQLLDIDDLDQLALLADTVLPQIE
jgi:alkanesulfonate monooxygenase SsuD/methylene tetrahydromethanopterin reductase-like flavin-dependent oxidoreductase (luciferase family)